MLDMFLMAPSPRGISKKRVQASLEALGIRPSLTWFYTGIPELELRPSAAPQGRRTALPNLKRDLCMARHNVR